VRKRKAHGVLLSAVLISCHFHFTFVQVISNTPPPSFEPYHRHVNVQYRIMPFFINVTSFHYFWLWQSDHWNFVRQSVLSVEPPLLACSKDTKQRKYLGKRIGYLTQLYFIIIIIIITYKYNNYKNNNRRSLIQHVSIWIGHLQVFYNVISFGYRVFYLHGSCC